MDAVHASYFETQREYASYFTVVDFDLFLAEAYIDQFLKLLVGFVKEDCFGCINLTEEHDMCVVRISTLLRVYWEKLITRVDQQLVYWRVLESDLWDPTGIDEVYDDSGLEFPTKHFEDPEWRQKRLKDPRLKSYWMQKIFAHWKTEYDGTDLGECLLDTS